MALTHCPLPRLLVVDDEASVRECLTDSLERCCATVRTVESMHAALQAMEAEAFDILLADICMPGASGLELLALSHQHNWDCSVILMTGRAELNHVVAGVRLHAADFLLKPFSLETLQRSVQNSFEKLQVVRQRRSERDRLSAGLRERTEQLAQTQHLLNDSYRSALETLVVTLEAREPATYAHSFRVRSYALHLASNLGYPSTDLPKLAYAALLHDLGKIAVSDAVLLKPGPLTPQEFEQLKCHAVVGERIVNRITFLSGAGKIVRHHHERWDGRGYPDGICGEQIPFGSRLFAVADTLDAMTSNRCYRNSLTLIDARREIERCSGSQFDPLIAHAFNRIPDETWLRLRQQADADAHAAFIPDWNPSKLPFFAPAPPASFPATALP